MGLRGLELPTKRLSAAIAGWEDSNLQPNDYQPLALSIDQRPACRDFVHSEVPEGVLRKWPIEFQ
jgi:hypothetical protein